MPKKLTKEEVQSLATGLLSMGVNVSRIAMAEEMDAMHDIDWDLDPELRKIEWMHPKPSTDPHDALVSATRALSAILPNVRINEHLSDPTTRGVMNKLETWAKIILSATDVKTESSLVSDFVFSALAYAEVTAVVDYLPYHYDDQKLKEFGEHEKDRIKEALKEIPFDIKVFHPAQCFVNYDKFGVKGSLSRSIKRIDEVVGEHGRKATKNLRGNAAKDVDNILLYCTYYDYSDTEYRYIWAIPQSSSTQLSDPAGGYIILSEERSEPFLQWTSSIGGTGVTRTGQPKRTPLLYSIYKSGQWDDQNLMDSIEYSMVAAMSARPQVAIQNNSGTIYKMAYWDPFLIFSLEPGDTIVPLNFSPLDPALGIMSDKESARMSQSTVSKVLMGAEPHGGVAFSTMNLAAQTAGKVLALYKDIAEQALAKVIKLMIKWMIFTKTDVKIPGFEEAIKWSLLPKNPKIKVTLTEDVPTDHMARINAAVNAIQYLGYSRNKALESIGEDDPQAVIREGYMEQLQQAEVAGRLSARTQRAEMIAGMENLGLQQMTQLVSAGVPEIMQMFQAIEQKLAQAEQGNGQGPPPPPPGPGPGGGGQENLPNPENQQSIEGIGGSANDPAAGGTPAMQSQPGELTKESRTRKTRGGEEF